MSLVDLVYDNLVHYNSWRDVQKYPTMFLSGFPLTKLSLDDPDQRKEWIVPRSMASQELSMLEIDEWFVRIEKHSGVMPSRITIALVNDDSTVSYYFVHRGIVKPRKN